MIKFTVYSTCFIAPGDFLWPWPTSSSSQVEDSSALTMLEEVTTVESRQDVAMTLVKIYLGQGLVVPFLDYLNTREVNHTSKIKGKHAGHEYMTPATDYIYCSFSLFHIQSCLTVHIPGVQSL